MNLDNDQLCNHRRELCDADGMELYALMPSVFVTPAESLQGHIIHLQTLDLSASIAHSRGVCI